MKIAPLMRAIRAHNSSGNNAGSKIEPLLIHTGQHYDYEMSQVFFQDLELPEPDVHLGVGSGTHAEQTGRIMMEIEKVFLSERPNVVVVVGDVNSTLAGALAAAKLNIAVAHVEAGLRSFRKDMPEEVNRVLTDHVSQLLFCPTPTAVENLHREGITKGIHLVGDVMYDCLLGALDLAEQRSDILTTLGLRSGEYGLATVHRAENTDDPERLQSIFSALDTVAGDCLPVVVPLHPRTRTRLDALHITYNGVRLVEPVSYLDMLCLEKHSRVVVTDSGGVQRETCMLGIPCVTLRDETEWPEAVEAGWTVLAGCNRDSIVEAIRGAWAGNEHDALYGNGTAASQIVRVLAPFRA